MQVKNIFELIKKFDKAEDQLSGAFGFLLANYPKFRAAFLEKINVRVDKKMLRQFDVETQVTYPKQQSRLDLLLTARDHWFILCESKIVSTKREVLAEQLRKYVSILEENEEFYEGGQRLVVILKHPLRKTEIDRLSKSLKCSRECLKVLSWEDLINLASMCPRTELLKLFQDYLGDSMHNKRSMNERKLKDVEEVLVIFTNPIFWEMTKIKNIAVQKRGASDAQYIAFLRTHLPKPHKSLITHIARVETTQFVPRRTMLEGLPKKLKREIEAHNKARNHEDWEKDHKQYNLKPGSMVELAKPIVHDVPGLQLSFRTTFAELLKANTTKDVKKGRRQ